MKYINLKLAKCLVTTIFLMIIGICAQTTNVQAQSDSIFEIQIPFDFVVKGRTFFAGKYRIERLDQTKTDVLILKNITDKTKSIVRTQLLNSDKTNEQSRLIFQRFGDIYYLDSIWESGKSYGSKFPTVKSNHQRRQMAAIPESISLIGN